MVSTVPSFLPMGKDLQALPTCELVIPEQIPFWAQDGVA
jgi:hypothetical protein